MNSRYKIGGQDVQATQALPRWKPMKLPSYIYHLAEESNYDSIVRDGLHSASSLFQMAGMPNDVTRKHRNGTWELPRTGVIVRHQRPMPPSILKRYLPDDLEPEDWYEFINSHVFFWADAKRLASHKKACHPRRQVLMTIDAERLVKDYQDFVYVTPFNTGNAMRAAPMRCCGSFVPLGEFEASGWETEAESLGIKRVRQNKPVEVALRCSVPNIEKYILNIRRLGPDDNP